MPVNIIEELRAGYVTADGPLGKQPSASMTWALMQRAADEIERLRAKITKADYLLTQGAPTLALEALQTP